MAVISNKIDRHYFGNKHKKGRLFYNKRPFDLISITNKKHKKR